MRAQAKLSEGIEPAERRNVAACGAIVVGSWADLPKAVVIRVVLLRRREDIGSSESVVNVMPLPVSVNRKVEAVVTGTSANRINSFGMRPFFVWSSRYTTCRWLVLSQGTSARHVSSMALGSGRAASRTLEAVREESRNWPLLYSRTTYVYGLSSVFKSSA